MATPDFAVPSGQPAPLFAPERTVSLPPSPHLGFDDVPAPGSARVRLAAGWVLSGLVLVFAFFAASFAARNSDLWLHLATGRMIAQGQYQIGVDPFAYTTDNVEWINHSWLFDWLLYLLFNGVGGVGLVLLKAIVVALLAVILLCVRRPNADIAWPAACATFAILVMSPRLQLQPACVSYLFLGITLWLLWKPQADPGSAGNRTTGGDLKYYVLLPLLCALWVNVDAWFLLGPLLIAFFWAGERLEGLFRGSARDATPVTPWWVLPASVAACLLNPHHFRAFTLPAELSAALTETGLLSDPRFSRFFVSPWQLGIHWQPAAAMNLAEWAYFLLVVLGVASFVFNWKGLSGWRLLVWVVFGLLGAWQIRATPFFAVVAGPITALNMQDFLSRLFSASRSMSGREPVAWPLARLASASAGLAPLVVLAWAGWLQGFQRAERKVAWEVQPDPSLQRVAETIGRWRQEGRLHEGDRAFPVHPDVGHYLAWYCPEEKGFLDSRFSLFHGVTAEYEEVCRGLNPALDRAAGGMTAAEDAERPAGGWRQVLHKHGVTYLILYDPDLKSLLSAASALAQDPKHWTLLQIDGQALIYGWNEGRGEPSGDPFAALRFDPERLVLGPADAQDIPAAPGEGSGRGPRKRDFWASFVDPAPRLTWESPAATVLLHHFEDTAFARRQKDQARDWGGFAAGLAGVAAPPARPSGVPVDVLIRLRAAPQFFADSERLPALPLLTVRAARRALAADPDDANAYLRLGQAYLTLFNAGGGPLEQSLPPLAMLRHIQTVSSLEQALVVNPDLEVVHQSLAAIYERRQYLDVALDHRRAEQRLTGRAGPRPGESPEQFADRVTSLEKTVQSLEDLVQERQNEFAIQSQAFGSAPLKKAQLALRLGLPRVALDDILLKSDVVLFGTAGARLELTLFLMLGRSQDAGVNLQDAMAAPDRMGVFDLASVTRGGRPQQYRLPSYEWLSACHAAATGDYDRAFAAFDDMREHLRKEEQASMARFRRAMAMLVTQEAGLMAESGNLPLQFVVRHDLHHVAPALEEVRFLRAEQADLNVMTGVLALEQGLPAEAKRRFRKAIDLCAPDGDPVVEFSGRPLAEAQLRRMTAVRNRVP